MCDELRRSPSPRTLFLSSRPLCIRLSVLQIILFFLLSATKKLISHLMRKQIISKQNGSFGILMSAECQLIGTILTEAMMEYRSAM